jgi:hypothetical protein
MTLGFLKKGGFELIFKNIDNGFSPSEIILESSVTLKSSKKIISKSIYMITVCTSGIKSIEIKNL